MRAIDGVVILVCAVEGVMPQTETVIRQAIKERVHPILFINKVDRLINELQVTPEQMQQGMDLLRQINADNPNTEEKLILSFNGFGDFAMNIMFIYYIRKEADIANTQTEINMEILRQFNANGLEFAFPTQTIYSIGADTQ
jgi:translation elongation factor EF-G